MARQAVPGELNMKGHFITFFLHNNPLRTGMVKRLIDYRWNNTNLQIGDLFGLTPSSISRRVTIIRKKMAVEHDLQRQIETFKSLIKP